MKQNIAVNGGSGLSLWLRFVSLYALICLTVFWFFRLNDSIWRFASYSELIRISLACFLTSAVHTVVITEGFHRMPISYYLIWAGSLQYLMVLDIMRAASGSVRW